MDMSFNDFSAFGTLDDPGESAAALRPLGWSELCARLIAARDLRRDQAVRSVQTSDSGKAHGRLSGSFHRGAAGLMQHRVTGKHLVNPSYSTYGKDHQGITVGSHPTSLTALEERHADENCHD